MAVRISAQSNARRVAKLLARAYPDAECSLDHRSPLELLIATILSAQCTDERVNIVTKQLFRTYRTAADYAEAPTAELEGIIKSTGFYRAKAKNIQSCCRRLVAEHDGQVPADLDSLVALAGVGRKTANVVLGSWFDIASGVVVDTHVGRLSRRLGLTKASDPVKVEQDLMAALPESQWVAFSHRMIQHGRRICLARQPKCDQCLLEKLCPKVGVTLKDRPSRRPRRTPSA